MSEPTGPRHIAVMQILNRYDLTKEDKEKQIESINRTFDKFYEKKITNDAVVLKGIGT